MLVSVVDGSRPLARIAGAFRGGGSVSVHVGPLGALAHIAERRRGTIAGACRGERPVWPVPASWAEASVSLSSQPGGACRCDSGFGCEQLDRQLARIVERRQYQCACTNAGAHRGAATVQVHSAVGRRLPGRRALSRWAAAVLLRALAVDGSYWRLSWASAVWPVLGTVAEAVVSLWAQRLSAGGLLVV